MKRSTVVWISVIAAVLLIASVSINVKANADYQDPAQMRAIVEQFKALNRGIENANKAVETQNRLLERTVEALEEHNRLYRNWSSQNMYKR